VSQLARSFVAAAQVWVDGSGLGLDARGRQESMALDDKGVMQVDFDEESRNYVTRLGKFLSSNVQRARVRPLSCFEKMKCPFK